MLGISSLNHEAKFAVGGNVDQFTTISNSNPPLISNSLHNQTMLPVSLRRALVDNALFI
jgi:hypothetical protein